MVEDTDASVQDVRSRFGDLAGECVGLLTDESGANRKARKAKTNADLAKVSPEHELGLVVKAADRLANVRACVADGNDGLLGMYRGEQAAFEAAAFRLPARPVR